MGAITSQGVLKTTSGNLINPFIYSTNPNDGITIPPFATATLRNQPYIPSQEFVSLQSSFDNISKYNFDSPLVIIKDGAYQGAWAEAFADTTGTEHTIFTLSNGNFIKARFVSYANALEINLYTSGGQLYAQHRARYIPTESLYCLSILYDEEAEKNILCPIAIGKSALWSDYSRGFNISNSLVDTYFLDESVREPFHWVSETQLVGNEGQFRMNLSQVKEQYIGDGLTQAATTDVNHFVISDMSLLRTLTNNCAVGEEVTIAYCGRNYMTFTRDASDPRSGVLKFYYTGGLLAYTSPLFVVNPSTTQFVYLCIYKDTTQHVAMIQIISYSVTSDPYYTWNHLYDTYGASQPTDDDLIRMWVWLSDNGHIEEDINPYDTGTTDDGGQPGNPRPQDNISDSPLPTLSGLESGIVTLYKPTATQLTQISAFLWSNDVLDNFKKYFNNFADNILSLSIMPFSPTGLSTKLFKVGTMQSVDIGQVEYSTQRFYDIDMGTVNIDKLWGSYLDYSPYTKCEIYLPYLGLHSLDIDELMSPCKMDGSMPATQGCELSLTYRLDILTGVIVAKIAVTNEFITKQIRYQFSGKCGASIPLTGQTYAQLVQSMATIGAGLISTVATSGMAAPMIAGAAAVAATVQSQKPSVERIGNISGDASMLATNVPYIILSSPNKALLEKQEEFTGFPSYKSGTLQNFTGYCEVIDAHVEGITCTEEERAEILSLLKAGVII